MKSLDSDVARSADAVIHSRSPRGLTPRWTTSPAIWALVAALLAFVVFWMLGRQAMHHPYIFPDDLVWEDNPLDYYRTKLLTEGRWGVWWWYAVTPIFGRPLTLQLDLALICATSALMGASLARHEPWSVRLLAALALIANPGVVALFHWPHTTLPMMVSLLVSVVFCYALRGRPRLFLLAVCGGAALTALTYQSFTMLFVGYALCLRMIDGLASGETPGRLLRSLILLVLSAGVGAVASTLVAYGFNAANFGHFGLVMPEWRLAGAHPGKGRLFVVLRNAIDTTRIVASDSLGLVTLILGAVFAIGATAARSTRVKAAILGLVLIATGFSFLSAPILAGVGIPTDRAGGALWLSAVAAAVAAPWLVNRRARPAAQWAVVIGLALLAGLGLTKAVAFLKTSAGVEAQNAQVISTVLHDLTETYGAQQADPAPVYFVGTPPITFPTPAGGLPIISDWLDWHFEAVFHASHVAWKPVACRFAEESPACAVLSQGEIATVVANLPAYPTPGYFTKTPAGVIVRLGRDGCATCEP